MNAPQQGFEERADAELKNAVLKIAIDRTTGNAERKRAAAVAAFPEFEAARARGDCIVADNPHLYFARVTQMWKRLHGGAARRGSRRSTSRTCAR